MILLCFQANIRLDFPVYLGFLLLFLKFDNIITVTIIPEAIFRRQKLYTYKGIYADF